MAGCTILDRLKRSINQSLPTWNEGDSAHKIFEKMSWDVCLANVRGVILTYHAVEPGSLSRTLISPKAFQKTEVRPFLKIGGECQRRPDCYVLGAMESHALV